MKKFRLIILLFSVVFFSSITMLSIQSNSGRIIRGYKICTIYTYNYFNGEIVRNSKQKTNLLKFNENGYLIEEINFKQKNIKDSFGFVPYDIMISENDNTKLLSDSSNYSRMIYIFNKFGKKTEQVSYDSNGIIVWKAIISYQDKGNISEFKIVNKDDKMINLQKFIYEENSYKITEEDYNANNIIIDKKCYINNIEKHQIDQVKLNKDRTITFLRSVKYDDTGNMIEDLRYSSKGLVHWNIKSSRDKQKFEYDKYGNIIEMTLLDNTNLPLIRMEYVYSN